MIYIDENYYKEKYLLGKKAVIDTASFLFYANKASKEIDKYTFGCATEIESVKMCCCELAETLYEHDNSKQKQGVVSEKVDEYSVNYTQVDIKSKINEIIRTWLSDTGLLYCGVK